MTGSLEWPLNSDSFRSVIREGAFLAERLVCCLGVAILSPLSILPGANGERGCGNDRLEFGPDTLSTPWLRCGKGPAITQVLKSSVSRPEPRASSALSDTLVGVHRAAGKPQKGFNNAHDLTLSTYSGPDPEA